MSNTVEGKEPRRDQILRIARRIFSEKTFHGTTLQDIADAVGMLKGSLYYYITSKERLLADTIIDTAHKFDEDLERVKRANLPPVERLRQIIREHINFNTKYRETGSLFLTERHVISSLDMTELTEIFDHRDKLLAETLSEAIEMGLYRPVEIRFTTLAIVGLCNSILFWYRPSGHLSAEEIADACFKLIHQGLSLKS